MIDVKIATKAVTERLKKLNQQLPYITAVSLTKTAQNVQKDMIDHTKKRFTIRKPWVDKGKFAIRITPAKKTNLIAKIWNDAPFMQIHEEGGEKKAKGKYVAIASANVKRNKKDLIPQGQRPTQLIDKGAFKVTSKNNVALLLIRKGRKGIQYLYSFLRNVRLKPTWNFKREALNSAGKHWRKNFDNILKDIMK